MQKPYDSAVQLRAAFNADSSQLARYESLNAWPICGRLTTLPKSMHAV